MSCNWCQDEAIARALLKELCGQDDESWKQDSDNDLCYCTPCVREYHRLKDEYTKDRPECTEILYKIEEERLKNHFGEFLSQKDHLSRSLSEISDSPYDIGDHLKVPSLELLRYPYLLFNSELMDLFVECLGLLIRNGTFDELDEKLPGIYLLLVNPCFEVRKWALRIAKKLGTISLEDYHCVSPVINCMLKIVLYGLNDTEEIDLEALSVPIETVDDDTNPLPHLFHPLPKKDLWTGLGVIFNALDDDVIRIFVNQQGHCQVFGILKNIMESTDSDSEAAFWPVLFCVKVLMTKLKSTFWLLADFEDAPKAMLDLICNHVLYKKELYLLDSRSFQKKHDTSLDEVTLSQLAEKEEIDESRSTESNDSKQKSCDPFFWIQPYITTVLDLEELFEKATCDVVQHLYSLVIPGEASYLDSSPTELNYFALSCLCDIIKYLLDHRLIFIVPDMWLSIISRLCFDSTKEDPSKRWMQLVRKAQSILTAMLKQAMEASADKSLEAYLSLLHPHTPGKGLFNKSVAKKIRVELEKILPRVLQTISQTAQSGLFGLGTSSSILPAFAKEEDIRDEKDLGKMSENDCELANGKSGTSDSPIYITDSDDEVEEFGDGHCTGKEGIIEPISYEEELDYSEEIPSDIERLNIPEALVCEASQSNKPKGSESAVSRTPQEINSKNEDSEKSLCISTQRIEVKSGLPDESLCFETKALDVNPDLSFEANGVNGNIEEDIDEVQGYNADFNSENDKAKRDSAEVNGCNDEAEVESNDERYFEAISSPETLEAADVDRHSVLTGSKSQGWLSHDKGEEQLLRTDFGTAGSSGRLLNDDFIDCIDDEMITFQSQCRDEDVVEVCTSDEVNGMDNKEKETKGLKVNDSSISQNVCNALHLPKSKSGDLTENQLGKEQLWKKQSKIYSADVGKETSRKRSSASSGRKSEEKRRKLEHMDNCVSLQKERLSAIIEGGLNTYDSGKAGNKGRQVDSTNDANYRRLPKQLAREENIEYGRLRYGLNPEKYSSKSPLERKGLFDFIGDLQKANDGNCESDEVMEPREVSLKENLVDEVIEEARGHCELSTVHADQNEEARKNMASAAFQRNKNKWYDECVKQQKSRTRSNSNTENASSSVGKSPERTRPADQGQLVKDNINVSKKITTVQKEALPVMTKSKHTRDSLLDYILTWHPAWMENEQHDELSINLPHNPEMVKCKYSSSDDYLKTMWPLILIEFFSQMNRAYREKERTPFNYKFKSFDTVRESMNYQIIHCQDCQESNKSVNIKEPNKDDLVILKYGDGNMIEVFGVIEEIEKTPLSDEEDPKGTFSFTLFNAKIRVAKLHPGMSISSMIIEVVTSMVSLYRKWEALIRMPESSLLAKDILAPFRPKVFGLANELNTESAPEIPVNKYNPNQRRAIAEITKAVLEPYTLAKVRLLQGPPGTGKTHTLTGLVKNILQSKPTSGNFRILVCAASNAAVDEIVFRLKNDPPFLNGNNNNAGKIGRSLSNPGHNCGDFNILRIGSKSQIDAKVETVSLEYLVKHELEKIKRKSYPNTLKSEIHSIMSKMRELDTNCTKLKMSGVNGKAIELKEKLHEREQLQRKYDELQKQMKSSGTKRDLREEDKRLRNIYLTKADILCCTLSGAGNVHMVNTFRNEWNIKNGIPFDCVIIDEAGQCCEPEAMIPLQYGSSKLVLVGDPAQLPATVFSKRALKNGYGQSLFERIQSAFCENRDGQVVESPVLMLTDQYRMHPAICEFPSQKFYNGKLSTIREVLEREFHPAIKPMVVLNIKSSLEANDKFGVIHNPEERKYVLHVCKEVVKRGISKPEGVGVITPYKKQLQELRREMSDGHLKKVEVHTVDGFQGREKDIIIISCVRAQSRIGFLENTQRMNVALTRAKHSMILIVHADTLQVNPDWKDLIDSARSRQLFFNVASIDEADKAIFVGSMANLHRTDSGSDTGERNIEPGSLNSSVATVTRPQNNELSDEEPKGKRKESNTLSGKGMLLVKEGGNSADIEDQMNLPLSDNDRLTSQASKCGKAIPVNEESNKPFPETNQNGDESPSCEKVAEKKPVYNGARNVKLPHTHRDGTKCEDRCYKAEAQTRKSTMPRGDVDGTNGVDKSVKTERRDRPSSAYFIFPHEHGDGLRCVDKCLRLETREKQRWQKERAMAAKTSNRKVEGEVSFTRQDSATSPREALVANENDQTAKSCYVSKDIVSEKDNKKQNGPMLYSESSGQTTDRKIVDVQPKAAEEGRESQENLKNNLHENEDAVIRPATEEKNESYRDTSETKATDPRLRKKSTTIVENTVEAPSMHSKSPEGLIAPQPRPHRPADKTEVGEREKKRKKEHTNMKDQSQEGKKKPRLGHNVSSGQVRAAPNTSPEGYSKTTEHHSSSLNPDIKVRGGSTNNGFRGDRISGDQGKHGNSSVEEMESIHPERRKEIFPNRSRTVRIVTNSKDRNGSSPFAMQRNDLVDVVNGADSFSDRPGTWKTIADYPGWRKNRNNDERSSRNRFIPREDEYRQRTGRETDFRDRGTFGSNGRNNKKNTNERPFDINSNNNIGFVTKNNNLKHSRYSCKSPALSRNAVNMRHTELSRNAVDKRHTGLSPSTANMRHRSDCEQEHGRNLEAVSQRIRANKGRHRQTQLLDSPASIHNGRMHRAPPVRRRSYTSWK